MSAAAAESTETPETATTPLLLAAEHLDDLIGALRRRDLTVIGPCRRGAAIAYDVIEQASDLPYGEVDEQAPGRYRVFEERGPEKSYFAFAVPAHSWKRYLFPPRLRLFRARREAGTLAVEPEPHAAEGYAFLGVRPCELAAIAIQDRVLLGGAYQDTDYAARRARVFIVAVNCVEPAATCFCSSMGTGPAASGGFDLCLTELQEPHRFLLEVGSEAGAELVGELTGQLSPPTARAEDLKAATDLLDRAGERMERLDVDGMRELLQESADSPRWDEVAARCLACANCTLVCPTCFCTAVEDSGDLDLSERSRVWDSCFSVRYSEMHGLKAGAVRSSAKARYRQWLTHKFSTWQDQFGQPGCVGCGRCITWCPAGIDVRAELRALRAEREEAHG